MGEKSNAPMDDDHQEYNERIANMIHEGGLGTMTYYNYEVNQNSPSQSNTTNTTEADQKS